MLRRSTRTATQLSVQARAARKEARATRLADRRYNSKHIWNPFTCRCILDTPRNRKMLLARRLQDLYLGKQFEISVKIYRPEKDDDGPGRQRSENGNVLMIQEQSARVTRRQLRGLQKGRFDTFEHVFRHLSIFNSDSSPNEFGIIAEEPVRADEPLDLRTSLARGDGRVDNEYIRFHAEANSEYTNPYVWDHFIPNACWYSTIIDKYRGPFNAYCRISG